MTPDRQAQDVVEGWKPHQRYADFQLLTAEQARNLLDYDPLTGLFTWRIQRKRRKIGSSAGHVGRDGYVRIKHANRDFYAHRLAWLITHGEWPTLIDHINGERTDNRIANLRIATASQNIFNARKWKSNSSGFKGVRWLKAENKWGAFVATGGKQKRLGTFDAPEDAHAAYLAAVTAIAPGFARSE